MSSAHLHSQNQLSTIRIGEPQLVTVNRFFQYRHDVVQFPDGSPGTYTYMFDDTASAATVPMEKRRGKLGVYLIWQERYPSQSMGWEVAAGGPKPGESQLQAAQRELEEEAGLHASLWQFLGQQLENIGRGNSRSDIFLAAGMSAVARAAEAEEVITDRQWFPMSEAEEMMLDGTINAGHTMASLALANAFIRRNPDHTISRHLS